MPTAAQENPFAPPVADARPVRRPGEGDPFARDRFLLKQKLIAINERYRVLDEDGADLLWVRRKQRFLANLGVALLAVVGIIAGLVLGVAVGGAGGFALGAVVVAGALFGAIALSPLRHIEICADPDHRQILLRATQDNRFAFPTARFSLCEASGAVVCRFRKNVLWNLVRRRWYIDAPDGSLLWLVKEDSVLKAILRRIAPDIVKVLLRTNFVFLAPGSERVVGLFNRKLAIRDHYVIDLGADPGRQLDRRIAVAMGVLLDTGERR